MTDALTGLGNRRRFTAALQEAAARANRGRGFAVLVADLNDFKAVNDGAGHDAGDAVLIAVAAALGAVARDNDVVCRLGGDEFVVIADGVDSRAACGAVAGHLTGAVHAAARRAGHPEVTVSVGGAVWGLDGVDPGALLRVADVRMYGDKAEAEPAPR